MTASGRVAAGISYSPDPDGLIRAWADVYSLIAEGHIGVRVALIGHCRLGEGRRVWTLDCHRSGAGDLGSGGVQNGHDHCGSIGQLAIGYGVGDGNWAAAAQIGSVGYGSH